MKAYPFRLPALCALLVLASEVWADAGPVPAGSLRPDARMAKTAVIITKVIERYHYKKTELDDTLSANILDRYIDALDPNRAYFMAADVRRYQDHRLEMDDQLRSGDLDAAFEIFNTYRMRVKERVAHALELLKGGFDFTREEEYRFDREDLAWPRTRAEMDELWRKRVKNDFLSQRLTDKEDEAIGQTLRKRYQGLRRRTGQLKSRDAFQIFVNAYTLSLEPHTSYMSPSTSENFDISMRLSLEGIGAVLRAKNEYTQVQKTINGGPAGLSGQIHAGDKIVGVAQGLDGTMEDVVGWRLQDVVEKIRGPKGSVVRLEIIPKGALAGARRKEVSLVRNKIKLEEQAAQKKVIQGFPGMGKQKIGVIDLPTFYRDFGAESRGEDNFRSTTRDVRKLLDELISEEVNGIVIDLRQNGGGSLSEATELTGLFIDRGPVVQVKDSFGKIEVEEDLEAGVAYQGPLAVLVNRNSASASEIFAGAIQDYRRGIIIGEPTFGKGTVQTLVALDRFVPHSDENLGRLRLTMAQFFRINGGSTQHKGVLPDVQFPTAKQASDHGERSLDNALPWDSIAPAEYISQGVSAFSKLREKSRQRVSVDLGFSMLTEQERLIREMEDVNTISLNEKRRRLESEKREKQLEDLKERYLLSQGISPREDEDEDDVEADEAESDAIGKIHLDEAARILADFIAADAQNRPRSAMR